MTHSFRLITIALFCVLFTWLPAAQANALKPIKFCVWDPVGNGGPFITFLKQTKLDAIGWGIDLNLEPYTEEKVASNDFKAGQCDAVFLTLILGKDYIPFAAAFGAPGAIKSLDEIKTLSKTINSPKAQKFIRHDRFELTGIFPIGEIYTFVKDRNEISMANIAGKKVSILNADLASTKFVEVVGASPVHTTLATWSGQFNNGNMDVLFGPALAYNTFELYKGLGEKGGIVRYNILYAVMEMIIDHTRFPEGFGTKMRDHALQRFDELEQTVKTATEEIPDEYWVDLGEKDRKEYDEMVKRVRLELRDEGKYDAKAITILWKIRCKFNPAASECSNPE